jgi:predicted PurR-regulated permease PerM
MHVVTQKFVLRSALVLALALSFLSVAYGFYLAFRIILLIGAGVLLAVFFDSLAWPFKHYLKLPHKAAVGVSITLLMAISVGLSVMVIPQLQAQLEVFVKTLPEAWENLQSQLQASDAFKMLMKNQSTPEQWLEKLSVFSRTRDLMGILGSLLTAAVITFFMGLYLALEPRIYLEGFLKLLPERHHARWQTFFELARKDLGKWLWGRFLSMSVIGFCIGLGLSLLGVPLALFMGLLAGLLSFIPYIGPLLSALPPVLFAWSDSPQTALWVVALFMGAQLLESYVLTPLIQKQAVSLPPALTLGFLSIFSVCAGLIGTALAAPLLVLILVAIRVFYLKSEAVSEPSSERA